MLSSLRAAVLLVLLLVMSLPGCVMSSSNSFQRLDSEGAYVVVGFEARARGLDHYLATLERDHISWNLKRIGNMPEFISVHFTRYDPAKGKTYSRWSEMKDSGSFWIDNKIWGLGYRWGTDLAEAKVKNLAGKSGYLTENGTIKYIVQKIEPGAWVLSKHMLRFSDGTIRNYVHFWGETLRKGTRVFHIESGEILYIGNVVADFPIRAKPSKFSVFQNDEVVSIDSFSYEAGRVRIKYEENQDEMRLLIDPKLPRDRIITRLIKSYNLM